jgi:hypothetical protein
MKKLLSRCGVSGVLRGPTGAADIFHSISPDASHNSGLSVISPSGYVTNLYLWLIPRT